MSAQHGDVATGPGWELRCGRWQEALAHVTECDALITDPPYSERTVSGHRHGSAGSKGGPRQTIGYRGFSEDQTREITRFACRVSRRYIVQWGDHVQFPWAEDEAALAGLFTFAPVPWVKSDGGTPRFTADGPASAIEWALVARTKHWPPHRFRPGYYLTGSRRGSDGGISGGKPIDLMRAIVRDYSEPGDLVVDPCAGGGTTLLAAVMEGRRAIGAEMDPATFDKAVARLRKGYTSPLPGMEAPRMEQTGLDL